MKYNLTTQHITITEQDHELLDKKLNALLKHLVPPYVTDVLVKKDQHHSKGDIITCSIRIKHGQHVSHASRERDTVQNALDEAIEAIRRELKKIQDKDKRHGGGVQR